MRKIDLKNFQVATSETAREINRRIVLNFLRTHQPISRADLARQSGLQFSTVSLIIEELIAEQWVTEGALTDAPRGRKPRVLHFNNDRTRIIGIDIRPTMTTIAMSDMGGRFVHTERVKTNADAQAFVGELAQMVGAFVQRHPFKYAGVGVSLPGRVLRDQERLAFAPNLGWRDLDIKTPLEQATGLPVLLENAPNACALAEIWFGAHGNDIQDLVAVTVSEGVGAGIFMNGQLLRGPTGLAGEFGHVQLDPDGPVCGCGLVGCWEAHASNSAALRYYRELATGLEDFDGNGTNGNGVRTIEDVIRSADDGNAAALRALQKTGEYLGRGLAMIVTALAPSVIVLVGEVSSAWKIVGPIIERVVKENIQPHHQTRIVPTDDQVHPRLRGALAVVLHNQLGAPVLA